MGKGDFFELLAGQLLKDQPRSSVSKIFYGCIIETAKFHDDEVILKGLNLLEGIYKEIAKEEAKEKSWEEQRKIEEDYRQGFICDLKDIYWEFPDAKVEPERKYDDIKRDFATIFHYHPTLLKSKAWIAEKVIHEWRPDDYSELSVGCFRFLIGAYSPVHKEWKKREGELEDEMKARGRRVFKEEQGKIDALVRKKTDYTYDSKCFEFWLRQPWIPEDLMKFLILGRARVGGRKLAYRDIYFSELLEPLNPEDSSPSALELHKNLCEKIRTLDLRVKELLKQMQDGWGLGAEKIGESEYVRGKIKITFFSLEQISIIVHLFEDCEEALGKDIAGRARRHIQAWKNEYGKELEKLHIILNVVGGKDNFNTISSL